MNLMSSKGKIPIPDPGEIERVFILRPDNLGDVVLFSGSLKHIRAGFPGAEITICVKGEARDLLERCPHVDQVLAVEEVLFPLIRCLVPKEGAYVSRSLQQPIPGGGHCGRFHPWGKAGINRVVRRIMDCYGCNWHCQYPTMQCVHDIPGRDVAEELEHILSPPESPWLSTCT